MPETKGENPGEMYRMMGVYSKNREEWAVTALACLQISGTIVAFYDTLGATVVEYILDQTELTTVSCSKNYVEALIERKDAGKADHL
jgi:long-chain acyl-CoA synthetase